MSEDDIEIIEPDQYSSSKGEQYSHRALVMALQRRCAEAGSREMRSGWFNEKTDKRGNIEKTYIDDTRKAFIESVKSLKNQMICDLDSKALEKIKELLTSLTTAYTLLCQKEKLYWEGLPISQRTNLNRSGIIFVPGQLIPNSIYYQNFIELQVSIYRQVWEELVMQTKRANFYIGESYEA